MAFTAIASIATTGFAAASAATILTAIAEVGTALSVVGAVTGSKDLMKFGAVMGVVGGVGGLVNGMAGAASAAGAAGSAAGAAGSAAGAAGSAATDSAGAGLSGMDSAADAGMSSASSGGAAIGGDVGASVSGMDHAADAGMGPYGGLGTSPVPPQDAVQGTNLGAAGSTPPISTDPAAAVGSTTPNATGVGTPADASSSVAPPVVNTPAGVTGTITPNGSVLSKAQLDGTNAFGANSVPGAYQLPPVGSSSFFGSFGKFITDNPSLAKEGLKFGLSALQSAGTAQYRQADIDMARQRLAFGNSVANTNPGLVNGRIN